MKIASLERSIERVGVGSSTRFTIEAAGKAFEILSSGLYKDKILAIVRELSTNAYDAHVAAGTTETPFKVQLPNALSPQFVIRDYGIGLNDEDLRRILTTYFHSTKTDSNEFVGALGLGFKSPFSFTDSFTIKSYFQGFSRTYVAFKNADGCPDLDEIGVGPADESGAWRGMPTTEPNGLEITVAVDRGHDHREFERCARQVYELFDPKPVVTGVANFTPNAFEAVTSGNGWKLRKVEGHGYSGARAIMGRIAYPIHARSITDLEGKLSGLLDLPIDIDFELGTLEFTAGREELSYDKRLTIPNLKTALARVHRDVAHQISADFEACPHEYAVRKLYGSYFSSGAPFGRYWRHQQIPIKWKGKVVNSTAMEFSHVDYPGLRLTHVSKRWSDLTTSMTILGDKAKWKKPEDAPEDEMSVPFTRGGVSVAGSINIDTAVANTFFRNDLKRGAAARMKQYLNRNPYASTGWGYYGSSTKNAYVVGGPQAIVEKFLANFPDHKALVLSEMETTTSTRVRRKAMVRVMTDDCKREGTITISKLGEEEIDLNEGGYFIITKNGRPTSLNKGEVFTDQWYRAKTHGLFDPMKMRIVVAPESVKSQIDASEGEWKDLIAHMRDLAKAKFDTLLKTPRLSEAAGLARLNNAYGFRHRMHVLADLGKRLPKDHPLAVLVKEQNDMQKTLAQYNDLTRLADDFSFELKLADDDTFSTRVNDLLQVRYPLLGQIIDAGTLRSGNADQMVRHTADYISVVDNHRVLMKAKLQAKVAA